MSPHQRRTETDIPTSGLPGTWDSNILISGQLWNVSAPAEKALRSNARWEHCMLTGWAYIINLLRSQNGNPGYGLEDVHYEPAHKQLQGPAT